jgi:hypothetical protein
MPQALIALFTNLAGVIGGALNGVLGTAVSMMKAGTKAALQFHQEGISLARDLGMGLNQANAYTKVLTERTQELAAKYGVTSDAIKAVQRNISETTGKQLILNDAQAEGFVQANKLVGEQTTNRFMDTIMNGMGGQVSTVQGAISKAYATAMKQGLNAQKFSKTVADNLSMANRLNFRNGIDGITRMAAMAEKFGLSMKSVETAAGQFMELDSAIEHSAHLQMLGGSIGAAFSNPLQNAYESMYDPEAFAKRMEDAMKGMATFDTKKGYATMSGINQDILRNYAKEMGLNAEEVIGNAKKMAEVRYKENKFSDKLGGLQLSEDQKNFLINNGQVSEGGNELLFNGQNVNNMSPDELKKQLDSMMQFEGKSDTDILKDQAIHLKSIDEALKGNAESIGAAFAKGLALDENAQNIINHIDSYGKTLQDVSENLGQGAGKALNGILNFVDENKDTLKNIANGIVKVSKFLADNWKGLLIAIGAWKLLLNPLLGLKLGKGVTVGGKLGAKALGGLKNVGGKAVKGTWSGIKSVWKEPAKVLKNTPKETKLLFKTLKDDYKTARGFGMSRGASVKEALNSVKTIGRAGRLSNLAKFAKSGGIGIVGALGNVAIDSAVASGKVKRGGVAHYGTKMASTATEYAAFGSILGPIGTGIGAAVGAVKGAYDTWKSLPENADKDFIDYAKSVGNSIVEGGKEAFNWAKEKVGAALSAVNKDIEERGGYLSVAFNVITTPIRLFINTLEGIAKLIIHPVDTIKNIWDKLTNWLSGDNILGKLFNKAVNAILGEKHASGGIVGASSKETIIEKHDIGGIVGGDSYSGDRILTGLNSGEMVLNKDQQAQLFKFIQNASNILTKIGSSNGVTYYNVSNKYSNLTSSYDTSRISSMFDNRSIREKYSAIHNNARGNVISSNDNRSIREKHSAIHNNVGGNTLSNILSTIFNSNSNVVSSALNTNNNIKTIPFGENSFRKIPKSDYTEYSYNKGGEISVKDIKLDVSGTIKLDGGNLIKNLDINQLLSDTTFISSLKDLIKQSINNDMNGGRFMNDNATLRGSIGTTTLWGRK